LLERRALLGCLLFGENEFERWPVLVFV